MGYLILIINKINYFYSNLKLYIKTHPHSSEFPPFCEIE